MVAYKGNIITVDSSNSIKKYLVEDNGKIVFVGDNLPNEYSKSKLIDLGNGAIMPPFADAHGHFASFAILASTVKLDNAKSIAEIQTILKEADNTLNPKKTLLCFGASPKIKEGRFITRKEIEQVVTEGRKVAIICSDGHTAILNKKALARMPKKVYKMNGFDCDTGIIGNEAFYGVVDNMLKFVNVLDGLQAFQGAIDEYLKQGFGLISVEGGIGMPFDLDIDLVKWIYRGQKSGIQMRFFIQSYEPKKALKRNIGRLGGCFKCALDGSITSMDAALLEPYEGSDKKGMLYYTDEEVYKNILKVHKAGLALQMHAIGDAAVLQAARAYKRVLDEFPKPNHRHGIIHATLVPDEAMDIIQKYKLTIIEQPGFLELIPDNYELMMGRIGEQRGYNSMRFDEYVKRNITVCASTDCPVSFPKGLTWLHWLTNNLNTPRQISLTDAIRICTLNSYYNTFDDNTRGSLEEGKNADFIILNKSPYAVPKEKIEEEIKVEATYLNGVKWTPDNTNIIKTILKGMFFNKQKKL